MGGTTSGCAQKDTTSGCAQKGTTSGCAQEGTTSGSPQKGTTSGSPQKGSTSGCPQEATSGCPASGTTSGKTSGCAGCCTAPQLLHSKAEAFETTTSGCAQKGTTSGCPQEATSGCTQLLQEPEGCWSPQTSLRLKYDNEAMKQIRPMRQSTKCVHGQWLTRKDNVQGHVQNMCREAQARISAD